MLHRLPNELLLQVYTTLDTLGTASKLSRTNKQLHELWISNDNFIIGGLLRPQITSYDDALRVAIAEKHHTTTRAIETEICLKDLAPILLKNAYMCQRLRSMYYEQWLTQKWNHKPWDDRFFSTMYYDCLLCALAHDWPALRRTARRRIKRLCEDDNWHYDMFMYWFLHTAWLTYYEAVEWHNLVRPQPAREDRENWQDWLERQYTDRWYFTMSTIGVYQDKPKDMAIGRNGHWDDYGEFGYRSDWE